MPEIEQPIPTVLLGDVIWSRSDQPSFDHCRVMHVATFNSVQGCVLTVQEGEPYRVDYLIQCDLDWSTRAVHVQTLRGSVSRRLQVRRDDTGIWWRDEERIPGMDGLVDIDLAISPSTNTLPIRRLQLEVGGEASTDAVWVRFPDLSLERLAQRYTRTHERRYKYESDGGSFTAELHVDDEGIVVRYGNIWQRVAPLSPGSPGSGADDV